MTESADSLVVPENDGVEVNDTAEPEDAEVEHEASVEDVESSS